MKELNDEQWARFGHEFFEMYRRPGFARMPKREIDILVFHLLEQHAGLAGRSETALAQELGSTPARIRGLRTDARYLYWDDSHRNREVRRVVFGAIANEEFREAGDRIEVQITDPFSQQVVRDILERNHQLHDTSFNRALLRIDRRGLAVLMVELLSEEQQEILSRDPATKALLGNRSLQSHIAATLEREAGGLVTAVRGVLVKNAASWLIDTTTDLPALLLVG